MLNNRELVTLILIGSCIVGATALVPSARPALWAVVKSFFAPKLAAIWLTFAGVVVGTVIAMHASGLSYAGSTKDAAVWAVFAGFALLAKFDAAAKAPGLMRETIVDAFRLAAFVDFFINFYVFPIWGEFVAQVVITMLMLLSAVAATDRSLLPARRFLDWLLAFAGFGLLVFTSVNLSEAPAEVFTRSTVLSYLQPVVLSVIVVALTYGIGLLSAYEQAFMRVGFVDVSSEHGRRAKLALMRGLNVRIHKVSSLRQPTLRAVAEQPNWKAALDVVVRYRTMTSGT